jgi:hypothetical protein
MSLSNRNLLDPWAIYESPQVDWNPHGGQEQVLESAARHRVWCAGRRTGKSDLGGHVLLPEALYTKAVADEWLKRGKRREFWIVGDEYVTADKEFRVIWNLVQSLGIPIDKGSHHSIDGKSQGVLSLWNNAFMIATQSARYPDNLVGEALCGVLMVEAAKSKPSTWQKHIRPMLNDYKGWSLHTSTPEGKNHFHEKFEMGQDPYQPDWASWRMPAWRNHYVYDRPTIDEHVKFLLNELERRTGKSAAQIAYENKLIIDPEILSLADELTIELFKQEVFADFTEFVGQVFKDYDEEYHVGSLKFNPDWATYAAVDYGFTNPNVWLLIQVGPWGEINVLDEVYQEGLTADQFAEEIKRRGLNPPQLRVFYDDPADPMSGRTLQDKLKISRMGGTGGELHIRINLIRQMLRQGRLDRSLTTLNEENGEKWRPRLMFDRKCRRTRDDMMAYRYPERKEDAETSNDRFENPMKKDDHGPEALGRFMVGHFGAGSLLNSAGTRVKKANISRHAGKSGRNGSVHRGKPLHAMVPTQPTFPDWKSWQQRGER